MLEINKFETIIAQMTLEEKIGMLHGDGFFQTKGVKRLGIPPLIMSDGPMGVRQEFVQNSWAAKNNNEDYVTYFPSNTALAATWNPTLSHTFGNALGAEARSRGKDIILAPGINIIRSPFCGRNFEYLSEDPYLTKKIATPLIQGIQENDVAACTKHYVANNQETRRLEVDVRMDQRTLEEIYLPAFEDAIVNGPTYTLMAAYNKFNGQYCCENAYLLNELLRNRFKSDTVVISDWAACHSTLPSALGGLDIEMAVTPDFDAYYFADPLYRAVVSGTLSESVINEKVMRILQLMDKLKMLDGAQRQAGSRNTQQHQHVALHIAQESIVLLKNDDQLLPLNPNNFRSIAIIGENGDMKHSQGGGSAEIKALYEHTPLSGIDMYLGGNHIVTYVKGYSSHIDATPETQFNLRMEALRIASQHDVVLFIGGLNHQLDTEGKDRTDYSLPYEQDRLVKELSHIKKDLITIILSGSAVDLTHVESCSKAMVQTWYNGMEGGVALANILFGRINPSGKLPFTLAKEICDYAAHSIGEFPGSDTVTYSESIFVGYRHFDSHDIEPLFAFGHGLSYTQFTYSDLAITNRGDELFITFTLKNSGTKQGKEIYQLYFSQTHPSEPRPLKELKAFGKVDLHSGESKSIECLVSIKELGFFSEVNKQWKVEKDQYQLFIGSSSKDIRLSDEVYIK